MLAVNEKMGFVKTAEWITFREKAVINPNSRVDLRKREEGQEAESAGPNAPLLQTRPRWPGVP